MSNDWPRGVNTSSLSTTVVWLTGWQLKRMNFIDVKLLWRDWKGGQLNLVVSALILAVMVVTAVSLFADRVERGLNQQISSFLASDLTIRGGIEISDDFRNKASELNLKTADIALFRSMVFAGDNNHLASVKAVSHTYPLRGQIELSNDLEVGNLSKLSNGPASGEAWVEARLFNLLDIKIGDKIEVGYLSLKVSQLIVNEPDRGTGFAAAGARVMISLDDLPASQLVRPGSRIGYRFLMSGDTPTIDCTRPGINNAKKRLMTAVNQGIFA